MNVNGNKSENFPGQGEHGALRHARSIFLLFYQSIFGRRPPGSYHYSRNDKESEITITSELPVKAEIFHHRPALILGRGPIQFQHWGLDDFDEYDHRTGRTTKTAMLMGTFFLYCGSRALLESESLAYFCASETLSRRDLLQRQGGFFDAGQTSGISAPSSAGSIVQDDRGDGIIITTVSLPFVLPWKSEIIPLNAPLLSGVDAQIEVSPQLPAPSVDVEHPDYPNPFDAPLGAPGGKIVYRYGSSYGKRLPNPKEPVAPYTPPKPIIVRFGVLRMAQYLPRPDVLVRQVLQTQTQTKVPPVMRGCVVGPCLQIVEPQKVTASGSVTLDTQARVSLPALLQAKAVSGGTYSLPARAAFVFSVNEKQPVTVYWEASGSFTPAQIVKSIQDAMAEEEETEALAETNLPQGATSFLIRTVARDSSQTLRVNPDGVAPARVTGTVDLTTLSLPGDVTGLTLQAVVNGGSPQTITITAGATTPANLASEVAALTGAGADVDSSNRLTIFTDAQGAGTSLEITGGTLLSVVGISTGIRSGVGTTPAVLAAFGFEKLQFERGADRYEQWELQITKSSYPNPRNNLDMLVMKNDTVRVFFNGSGTSLTEALRTSAPLRRATGAVTVIDDGDGDNRSPILSFAGADFTAAATQAVYDAANPPTFASLNGKTLILGDGRAPRVVTFGPCTNLDDVIGYIHQVFDPLNGLQASNNAGALRLTSTRLRPDSSSEVCKGLDSTVVVYGGTVFDGLSNYIDPGGSLVPGRVVGSPYEAKIGDEVYLDGQFAGRITKVAPGGSVNRLRLSSEKPLSFTADSYYIVAKGLSMGDTTRPYPSLIMDGEGRAVVKHTMMRSAVGQVSEAVVDNSLIPSKADIYLGYHALRLDVSNRTRGLLQLQDTEMVEQLLSPVDERNPLALGAFLALRNSPSFQITALGVDEISSDHPDGTPQSYARAASHLEAFDVYGIALLTHSQDAADIFQTHVTEMSKPEGKLERLVLWCPKEPTHALDDLVASGSQGNTVGSASPLVTFDTGVADLASLLSKKGILSSTPTVGDGVYLDVETDGNRYSVNSVVGSVVTVRSTFAFGENADGFYATGGLPGTLVDVAFGIRIRGKPLVLPDNSPDLEAIAEAMAQTAESYSDRRVWVIGPDEVYGVVRGQEQALPGYYAAAAIAGMLTHYPVSQSFTNLPMAAVTRVLKTTGRFTEKQLSRMAGGGVYLLIQDGATSPVIARQAITSDATSVEARMDVILKEIDLLAKLIRVSLRSKLGLTNISEATLDDVGVVVQSVITTLTNAETPLLRGAQVLEIGLSPASPDRLAVAVRAYPHYALNGIDVTIYT